MVCFPLLRLGLGPHAVKCHDLPVLGTAGPGPHRLCEILFPQLTPSAAAQWGLAAGTCLGLPCISLQAGFRDPNSLSQIFPHRGLGPLCPSSVGPLGTGGPPPGHSSTVVPQHACPPPEGNGSCRAALHTFLLLLPAVLRAAAGVGPPCCPARPSKTCWGHAPQQQQSLAATR